MATVTINTADIVASVEKYLLDNAPVTSVTEVLTAHEAANAGTDVGEDWVGVQWVSDFPQVQPMRSKEDWRDITLRLVCYSRSTADRLRATRIADDYALLVHNTTMPLLDRDDVTSELGKIWFHTVTVSAAEWVESLGARLSIMSAQGWAVIN